MTAHQWFFKDQGFEFLTLIALGSAPVRLSEVGEVLETVSRIEDGDVQSFVDHWLQTGERVGKLAAEAEAAGDRQTARDAHLRAAMYMGTGFFNILGSSHAQNKVAVWKKHRAHAEAAFGLWPTPTEKVAIPYEDTELEGYFFSGGEGKRPILIFNNGSDGTIVEMLGFGLEEAVERGYHALAFDGPGQGQALYIQGLFFRHDWEKVITPVVDWSIARGDVDGAKVALFGCSQAGYWVPRAAAFEHRLAAAIADPGVVDVANSWTHHFPAEMLKLLESGDKEQFDGLMDEGMAAQPIIKATLEKRLEPFGSNSIFDVLIGLKDWNIKDHAGDIDCPVLITDPDDEQFWPGESKRLYDLINAPKELMRFTAAQGANWHCEPMAPIVRSHKMLDWLDRTLGRA